MDVPVRRTVTTTRIEYVIPNDSDAKALGFAVHTVHQEIKRLKGKDAVSYDDAYRVRGTDEEIIFYFETETEGK